MIQLEILAYGGGSTPIRSSDLCLAAAWQPLSAGLRTVLADEPPRVGEYLEIVSEASGYQSYGWHVAYYKVLRVARVIVAGSSPVAGARSTISLVRVYVELDHEGGTAPPPSVAAEMERSRITAESAVVTGEREGDR